MGIRAIERAAPEPGPIAITGFGAFGGVRDNPSTALLEELRSTPVLMPDETRYHLLDVRYGAVAPALETILGEQPAALVLTGYTGLRLEQRAQAFCSPDRADAFGLRPTHAGTANDFLEQHRADLPALAHAVADTGIACTVSRDAGAYVCNHLYHQASRRIAASGAATLAVFVHVPAITGTGLAATSAGSMTLAAMAHGVSQIATELARMGTLNTARRPIRAG